MQLRNLINRRNVRADTSQRFNESIDFFQLVVECHVIAAAMHFFSMTSVHDTPSTNLIPSMVGKSNKRQWSVLREALTKMVNKYMLVDGIATGMTTGQKASAEKSNPQSNPHLSRIASDHTYSKQVDRPKKGRKLPDWIAKCGDESVPIQLW